MKASNIMSILAIIFSLIAINTTYDTVKNYKDTERKETACTSVTKMNSYTVTVPTVFNDLSSILVRVDSRVITKYTEMNIRKIVHETAANYSGGQTKDFADELYTRLRMRFVDNEKDIRLYKEHTKGG